MGNPLNEHDDEKSKDSRNRMIQALSKKTKVLQQRVKRAEGRIPPRASITLTRDGNLSVQKSISSNGLTFFHTDTVMLGEAAKYLAPIISQVVNLTRAAALGVDYRKRTIMHEEDPNTGEVTRTPKLDENGHPYKMPNSIDRLQAISKILMESAPAVEALKTLSKCLMETDDAIYNEAISIAQAVKSKSDPGTEPEKKGPAR